MKRIISCLTVIVIILGSLTACSVKIADGNKFGGNYYISSMVADMLEKNSYYDHTLSDEALAKAKEAVAARLEGFSIVKEIYVPGRIINLVVKKA